MRAMIWRNRASAILGFLVAITPFTGFGDEIKTFIIVALGLMIMIFGLSRGQVRDYSYKIEEVENGGDSVT